MPRIRTIKPDAFLSETLSSVPRGTRWTFAGLWTFADDKGRARDDARLIHAALYPLDDETTVADVAQDLDLLAQTSSICRYIVEGRRYLHVPRWHHQKINRPTPAKHPPCPAHEGGVSGYVLVEEPSPPAHGGLTESSGWEGKGREEEGKGNRKGESGLTPDADADKAGEVIALQRPEVEALCDLLADLVEGNGSKRPAIGKTWRDAARLMLDRDGRTVEDITGAIRWSQADPFWRSNILSMPKLREKYDTLRLQAARGAAGATSGPSRSQGVLDRALARAEAREAAE